MKLDVPYKFVDLQPDDALLNFDFNCISLEEWTEFTGLKDTLHVFKDIYTRRVFGPGPHAWKDTSLIKELTYFHQDSPVNPLILSEVSKLEKLYNARAIMGSLDGMPAGSKIFRHFDQSPIFQITKRVHLPLVTHPDVKFFIDDIPHYFPAGKFFEFDNSRYHEVINDSPIFRIHLIVDLLPNPVN